MIKLIAHAAEDGCGIIKEEHSLYLIKPPYKYIKHVNESFVEMAITKFGYSSTDKDFDKIDDAISFLRNEMIISRQNSDIDFESDFSSSDLIRESPYEIILNFITRIQNELSHNNNHNYSLTIKVIIILLKNEIVKNNDTIYNKILDLLEECNNNNLFNPKIKYPS